MRRQADARGMRDICLGISKYFQWIICLKETLPVIFCIFSMIVIGKTL
ncbi:hypothetical protein NEICINOT_04727 [Neisseria cinerea ATCC 14685]|uniref:Uncharacterized protein n=1 Tax=Neisseria cinerea ATCC 14685 TaxID=546262 RepID=D0W4X9_NEICI|nr:hypothetical protein NEICINOT_04727 [Neisseria cinerea ATCC 14685]